ncbi:MAG: hypothetical protein AAGA56_11170, partial [Myxococcota bacterium]
MTITKLGTLLLSSLLLTACSSDDGSGDARFVVWGEEFIEQGIEAAEFEDGWAVTFDHFYIVVGDVSLFGDGKSASLPNLTAFDLVQPGPQTLGTLEGVDAGAWTDVGFRTPPATDAVTPGSAAGALDTMRSEGASIWVSGAATKDSVTKTFSWTFTGDTRYSGCVDQSRGQ